MRRLVSGAAFMRGEILKYTVKRSSRRTLSLEILPGGGVLVRAPFSVRDRQIAEFVERYSGWIEKKLPCAEKRLEKEKDIVSRERELRAAAEKILPGLVEKYSAVTGLVPSSVKITSAKTRFGSCSSKNAVCFSWRLMAYPPEAVEYVVLHELAHIKHHNHSRSFYALIGKYMPDYERRRKMLKIV